MRELPTQLELQRQLHYDAITGELLRKSDWKPVPTTAGPAGRILTVNRQQFPAHRLVWVLVHGSIPAGRRVVFKNGDKGDLRLENLTLKGHLDHRRGWTHQLIEAGGQWKSAVLTTNGDATRVLGLYPSKQEAVIAFSRFIEGL